MSDLTGHRVPLEAVAEKTVGDVMIRRPKTLAPGAHVGDVRRVFERPAVRTVLLAENGRFAGAIERGGLPVSAGDDEPANGYIEPRPLIVTPAMPMSEAVELLDRHGEPRLIVLDEDGVTLRGLLCANGDISGFCVR